jgi:hypothetical protein
LDAVVTIDDVRAVAADLPRSYEVLVRGRVKFRVGRIVYVAFSRDETEMGFGFPKEERDGYIETYPEKFFQPAPADLRYNWLEAHLDVLDFDEMRELVLDAWAMCVPRRVSEAYFDRLPIWRHDSAPDPLGHRRDSPHDR